jgi:predicted amidohydrolase
MLRTKPCDHRELSPERITAGVVQWDIRPGDMDANLGIALDGLRELARSQTDMVVLPEMWSCSFDNPRLAVYAARTPDILRTLRTFAADHHLMIAASMPEATEAGIYNTTFLIEKDGTPAGAYRKMHLFSPTGEDRYFAGGTKVGVFRTSLGCLGIMTCYDLRFPELCRTLTERGAQLVLVSAQWPMARVEHWDILLRARAIENQLFVVAANRCGKEGKTCFPGHSQVVSPFGRVLGMMDDTPGVLQAGLDYAEVSAAREAIPCLTQRMVQSCHV